MPKTKPKGKIHQKPVSKIKKSATRATPQNFSQLKMSESYVSLILGALVVLVFAAILFFFLKGSGDLKKLQVNLKTGPRNEVQKMEKTKTYDVQEGEGLYEIAEKVYGNGDYWVNIAQANNLTNPDQIEVGMKLIIPDIKK